jgi:hypothetical protein
MALIWLLVFGAAAERIQTSAKADRNVIVSSCDSYETLCRLCNATEAYEVQDTNNFAVGGWLTKTNQLFKDILQDLEADFDSANYTIATGDHLCVAAWNVTGSVDYADLFERTLDVEYHKTQVPEIFSETEFELEQVDFKVHRGEGSRYYYEAIQAYFDAQATAQINNLTSLNLSHAFYNLTEEYGLVNYTGSALVGNISTDFFIEATVQREKNDAFTAVILAYNKHTVANWTGNLTNQTSCAELQSVSGLDSVVRLAVQRTEVHFVHNDGEMQARDYATSVKVPSFTVAPGIKVKNPKGSVYILDSTCTASISGDWTQGKQFGIELEMYTTASFNATAWVAEDPPSLTLEEVQSLLVDQLYPDPRSIIPQYVNDTSDLEAKLLKVTFEDPSIYLSFDPEVSLRVSGVTTWVSDTDSRSEVMVTRLKGLQSTIAVKTEAGDYIGYLYNSSSAHRSLDSVETQLLTATTTVDVDEESKLKPSLFDLSNSTVKAGITVQQVRYDPSSYCEDLEFCSILTSYITEGFIKVNGTCYPSGAELSRKIDTIDLGSHLELKFAKFRRNYRTPDAVEWITGALSFYGDSKTLLTFHSNVTENLDQAFLEGLLTEPWTDAFDYPGLTVLDLVLKASLDSEGEVEDSSMSGLCQLGNCTDDQCWDGYVRASVNPNDYLSNQLILEMEPAETELVFSVLLDTDTPPQLFTTFDFYSGLVVEYAYKSSDDIEEGVEFTGNVGFLGVPGYLEATNDNSTETFHGVVLMTEFFLGHKNVEVLPNDDSLYAEFTGDKTSASSTLYGKLRFWYVQEEAELHFNDTDFYSTDVSGNYFEGLYDFAVSLHGKVSEDIEESEVRVQGRLTEQDEEELTEAIEQALQYWVSQGNTALNTSSQNAKTSQHEADDLKRQMCTEACPNVTKCSQLSDWVCAERAYNTTCIEYGQSCGNLTTECKDTATECMSSHSECTSYYSSGLGDECLTYETVCDTELTTCQHWKESCSVVEGEACTVYELHELEEGCINWRLQCDEVVEEDGLCRQNCDFVERLYNRAEENAQNYSEADNRTQADMEGFTELADYEVLFKMNRTSLDRLLDEEAIGASEVWMSVFGYVAALGSEEEYELVELSIAWNFFDREDNNRRLAKAAKQAVVDNSGGKLDGRLASKSAVEVMNENLSS